MIWLCHKNLKQTQIDMKSIIKYHKIESRKSLYSYYWFIIPKNHKSNHDVILLLRCLRLQNIDGLWKNFTIQ